MNKYNLNDTEARPWGNYAVIETGKNYVVKKITVNPNGILSYQRHQHRAEHWVVVSGNAVITLDDKQYPVTTNQHFFIPQKSWHRIANPHNESLTFIEVQTGDILDESDIERKDDKYNR